MISGHGRSLPAARHLLGILTSEAACVALRELGMPECEQRCSAPEWRTRWAHGAGRAQRQGLPAEEWVGSHRGTEPPKSTVCVLARWLSGSEH